MSSTTELFVAHGAILPTIPSGLRRQVKIEKVETGIVLPFVKAKSGKREEHDLAFDNGSHEERDVMVDRWVIRGAAVGFADNFVRVRPFNTDERIKLMDSSSVILIKNGRLYWNFRFCKKCKQVHGVSMDKDSRGRKPRKGDFWFHCYHCGDWWKRTLEVKN